MTKSCKVLRHFRLVAVPRLTSLIFGAIAVLHSIPARAQDFQQVAPKQPAGTTPGKITAGGTGDATTTPPAAARDDGKLILQVLRGLRFVPHASDVVKVGIAKDGLDVSTVRGLDDPDLDARLQAYIGRPLTIGDLNAITRTVIAYFRAHQRPLVDVAVPEQDVTSGVIQIVVTEFTLGRVKVTGNRRFSRAIIERGIEAQRGRPLDLDQLRHDLDWLNRNPFRRVDAVLARGSTVGTTDVQLNVQERFPLRVYAAFDNSGTPATGRDHWDLGVNLGNLFGGDQQLSYQFTAGDDFPNHITDGKARFVAHSASYFVPLPWHDLIEIFGSYVRQSPDLGPFFGQTGYSWQASARYIHNLGGPSWLTQDLQFGYDHKSTDNNLAFGGTQVFSATQSIDQFLTTYDASVEDPWGVTTLQNDLVYSPGGLSGDNTDAAFAQSSVVFAKAGYVYDTLTVGRTTLLPFDASWVMHVEGQWANGNLLPSEQLGGGGEGSVRGYDTRIANGSQGVQVSEELRTPPFHPLGWVFGKRAEDGAQLLAFWDFIRLSDPRTQPGNPDHLTLASAGLGFNYVLGRTLNLRADYGWQLETPPGATHRGGQANLAVTISY